MGHPHQYRVDLSPEHFHQVPIVCTLMCSKQGIQGHWKVTKRLQILSFCCTKTGRIAKDQLKASCNISIWMLNSIQHIKMNK